jgi:hypothetical protein
MKWLGLAGVLLAVALACHSLGWASPEEGQRSGYVKLEAGAKGRLEKMVFKGNERACVILIGDHEPVVDLVLSIYDSDNNLVTRDDPGGDYCAAIWYPTRDAAYTIEVENRGQQWNKCWIAFK